MQNRAGWLLKAGLVLCMAMGGPACDDNLIQAVEEEDAGRPDADAAQSVCEPGCHPDEQCAKGACECGAGKARCGPACVDILTDTKNCGECGLSCGLHASCIAGSCKCATGYYECAGPPPDFDPMCMNLATDREHCGQCGIKCGFDQDCHEGSCGKACTDPKAPDYCAPDCTNLKQDPTNCGQCGKQCQWPVPCNNGTCAN